MLANALARKFQTVTSKAKTRVCPLALMEERLLQVLTQLLENSTISTLCEFMT